MAGTTYLDAYAADKNCLAINTNDSSDFARIWIQCMTCGVAIACVYLVPYFQCGYHRRTKLSQSSTKEFGDPPDAEEEGAEGEAPLEKAGDPEAEEPPELDCSCEQAGAMHKMSTTKASWNPEEDSPEPNLKAAKEHLRKSSPTDMNCKFRGVWSTSLVEVGMIGGPGLELYFRLLQRLGIALLCMSVLTLPIVAFSSLGNFAPETGNFMVRTTIGNLGWIAQAGLPQEERWILVGCQGVDIREYTKIFGWLDVVSTAVFLVIVAYFRFVTIPILKKETQEENLTVADFGLLIDKLPRVIEGQASYEEKLKRLLEERMKAHRDTIKNQQWRKGNSVRLRDPQVHEIALVRDYNGRLSQVKSRAELMLKRDIEAYKGNTAKVEKLDAKIKKKSAFLAKKIDKEEELPVVRAYAILDTPFDAEAVRVQYSFSRFAILRCCQSEKLRFEGHPIRITRPTEPSSLIVENQDIPLRERRYRWGIMFVLSFLALLLSIGLITLMNVVKGNENAAAGSILGSGTCDTAFEYAAESSTDVPACDYMNATLWTEEEVQLMDASGKECYCMTKGFNVLKGDSSLTEGVCEDWLKNTGFAFVVNIGASVVVVVLNTGFRMAVTAFAESEKPLTISQLEESKMTKIFFSQFFNTALIIVIVNYHFATFGLDLGGYYDDTERGWYTVVGGTIVFNMMLNAVLLPAGNAANSVIKRVKRCCKASKAKHQVELIDLYTNPKFDISARFAQLMMFVFVTLFFNAGMPFITPCACVYCLLTYWCDKYILLRGSRRPPIYDTELPTKATDFLLFSVPCHLVMAIIMYSHQCTFPSEPLGGTLGSLAEQGVAAANDAANSTSVDSTGGYTLDRLSRESTWVHTVLLAIYLALLVVKLLTVILGATVGEGFRFFATICCPARAPKIAPDKAGDERSLDQVHWEEAQPTLQTTQPPTSYKLENSLSFEKIAAYLDKGLETEPEPGSTEEPEHTAVTPMTPVHNGKKEPLPEHT